MVWLMSPDPAPLTQAQLKAVDQLTGGSAQRTVHCSKKVGGAKLGFIGKPGSKFCMHKPRHVEISNRTRPGCI